VTEHIESLCLLELAQMPSIVHRPAWDHIKHCGDCGRAFLVLRAVVERWQEYFDIPDVTIGHDFRYPN
jgi:hypothetical protein